MVWKIEKIVKSRQFVLSVLGRERNRARAEGLLKPGQNKTVAGSRRCIGRHVVPRRNRVVDCRVRQKTCGCQCDSMGCVVGGGFGSLAGFGSGEFQAIGGVIGRMTRDARNGQKRDGPLPLPIWGGGVFSTNTKSRAASSPKLQGPDINNRHKADVFAQPHAPCTARKKGHSTFKYSAPLVAPFPFCKIDGFHGTGHNSSTQTATAYILPPFRAHPQISNMPSTSR